MRGLPRFRIILAEGLQSAFLISNKQAGLFVTCTRVQAGSRVGELSSVMRNILLLYRDRSRGDFAGGPRCPRRRPFHRDRSLASTTRRCLMANCECANVGDRGELHGMHSGRLAINRGMNMLHGRVPPGKNSDLRLPDDPGFSTTFLYGVVVRGMIAAGTAAWPWKVLAIGRSRLLAR